MTYPFIETLILTVTTFKGYIIFFLTPGLLISQLKPEEMEEIDSHIKNAGDIKNIDEARQMIQNILQDDFSSSTIKNKRNLTLLKKLRSLKIQIINYYIESSASIDKQYKDIVLNCDIHTTIGKMILQLMRFRMVIQPEIQVTINKHKQTNITYLKVKGFWLNDDGQKLRKFQKSFGRADEYKFGKEDPKAIEDGCRIMQEILNEEYFKYYPD